MKSLAVDGVTKTFGAKTALQGVSLETAGGRVLTVLGPSGGGKTTLLRIIAGLEDADSGRVLLNGRCVTDGRALVAPEDRAVGMVFQDIALWPHMTVLEQVTFPLSRVKISRAERRQRAEEVLRLCRANGLAQRYPAQISSGEAQRVALARALVTGPDFLLLDEPFSGVQRALRADLSAVVETAARRQGAAVLCVTHSPEDMLPFSDRVAVMSEGAIAQVGAPQELYARPRTRLVAELLGPAEVLPVLALKDAFAETPFGPVQVEQKETRFLNENGFLVVRPGQLVADPNGPLVGRIAGKRFVSGRPACLVTSAGQQVTVLSNGRMESGTVIRFRVEGQGVLVEG
jgi:ABC-type Fe3+/spermidine/putrescine transport system ATPase subunit